MHRLSLVLLLALSSHSWAFDVSPHQVGDSLNTEQASALLGKYEKRARQPWREPDAARMPQG
jgi:thiosulfate dehydrogenase